MKEPFKAVVVEETDGTLKSRLGELTLTDLPDEDVLIEVSHSTVNYKDGLAVSGHSSVRIAQRFPMVAGIDLAGMVVESRDPQWQPGDRVLVNGYGLAEHYWGGYCQYARMKGEWLVRIPDNLSNEQAMAFGTAGYTAMLCVLTVLDHGVKPEDGPILVTGASGGVGSVALSLLADMGCEVTAVTGNVVANEAFLKGLGAQRVIARDELARPSKPLEAEQWTAVVDCVGGSTVATALAQVKYGGVVAMTGLAGGVELNTTVMPFILRNVALKGVDSVMASQATRQRAWHRIAETFNANKLAAIYQLAPLTEVIALCDQILAGTIKGRVVIEVQQG